MTRLVIDGRVNCYQTNVRTLSDQELKVLSAEIEEAYSRESADGDPYWLDEEAGDRYYSMQGEISRRRFERMTPEEREKWKATIGQFSKMALEAFASNAVASEKVNTEYAEFFSDDHWPKGKIGATLEIRKPGRFVG